MRRFACDLHVHSCLSPCADDDMTPCSIAGMAKLNGLELVALTDHNSCGNCEAFFDACAHYGIVPVAGMELTTAEDIHMICLFPTLEQARAFDARVQTLRISIPNRAQVFGNQLLIGGDDEVTGEEPNLLINATMLTLSDGAALAEQFGGAAYPAHIDRESNGIIAVLGTFPQEPAFAAVEYHNAASVEAYASRYNLANRRVVVSSDAHQLWKLADGDFFMELDCTEDAQSVRNALIAALRGRTA